MQSVDELLAQLRAQQSSGGGPSALDTALTSLLGGVPTGGLLGGGASASPATNATDLGSLLTQGVDLGAPPPPGGFDRLANLPSAGSSSAAPGAPAGMAAPGLLSAFTDPPPQPSQLSRGSSSASGPSQTMGGSDTSLLGGPPASADMPDAPRGLLGGVGHAVGGFFGGLGSYLNDADPTTGLTGADRIRRFAASMRDDPRYGTALDDEFKDRGNLVLKRAQLAQENDAVSAFLGGGNSGPLADLGPGSASAAGTMTPTAAPGAGINTGSGVTSADGSHMNAPDPTATKPGAPMLGLSDTQRKGLAAIALRSGHADQAASIMSGDVTSDSNGYMIDHKTGQVLGKLPIHQYVNGFNVDPNSPDAPKYVPNLPNGIVPDGAGGVTNAKGYVGAMAAQAGATTDATAGATARYDLVAVPDGRGGTRMMPRSVAAALLGGSGGGAAGAGSGSIAGGITPDGGGLSPAAAAVVGRLPRSGGRRGAPAPDASGMGGGAGLGVAPSAADTALSTGRAQTQVTREAGQPKAFNGLRDQARTTDFVLNAIDGVLPKIGNFTAGFGSSLSGIKGTPAHDLQASLDTIRANVGFDRLQTMRDSSPTGGALGQVSEQENKLLQSVAGSLDAGQSPDQLRSNLMGLQKQLRAIKAQRSALYDSTYAHAGGGGSSSGGGFSQADMRSAALAELARRRAAGR